MIICLRSTPVINLAVLARLKAVEGFALDGLWQCVVSAQVADLVQASTAGCDLVD